MYITTYLSHTADAGISIQATSLAELFEGALEGMNNLIKKNFCREAGDCPLQEFIRISAPDTTSLLVDFLSAILTLSHINKAVYCRVHFEIFEAKNLEGTVWGKELSRLDEDIKAVTYHQANVKQNPSGLWETNILFDI